MLKGFQDRLKAELVKLAPADSVITITAAENRKNAVWRGAATLGSTQHFANTTMITKEEFTETGVRGIIAKKNA